MTTVAVTIKRHGATALVSLESDRPLEGFAQPLAEAVTSLADDEAVRVILLVAPGGIRSDGYRPAGVALSTGPGNCAGVLATVRKPTLAALDGDCLDGGLELALACDIRVAGPGARFALRHVHHGALPADGGTQRLSRLVGRAHALRLLLTGDVIGAEEAVRIGLVQALGGLDEGLAIAERIAAAAPIATEYVKEAAREGADLPLAQGLRLEADLNFLLQSTADRAEGLKSFRERRSPEYRGQ